MSNHRFSSTRRRLLDSAPAAAVTLLMATGFAPTARAVETHAQVTGPVMFYADVRVAQPNKAALDAGLQAFANSMVARGALAVTLKQMVGDSTMVKNYPESYKGLLKSAMPMPRRPAPCPCSTACSCALPTCRRRVPRRRTPPSTTTSCRVCTAS